MQIADRIEERIVKGRLAPGTSLPSEDELTRQFGVSRGPVREAAKMLKQRGLVDVSPGIGMTVAAPFGSGVTKQLIASLRMNRTSPAQLFEVRELLDTAVCRAAAANRTDGDIRELRRILQDADSAPDDPTAYLQLDLGFHQALARSTKNPFYSLVVGAVFLLLRDPSLAPLRYASNRRLTQAEHREMLAGIESGDADEAAVACLRHLKRVRRSMEALRRDDAPDQAAAGTTRPRARVRTAKVIGRRPT